VSRLLWVLLFALAGVTPAGARDLAIEDFYGVYVGRARVLDGAGKLLGERDLDISIEPGRLGGFRVSWISVELVQGRRDVPGVERRMLESVFRGARDGYYAEDTRRTLFARRQDVDLLEGDVMRWARILGNVLSVYALALTEDGGYEVQAYDRIRTEAGMEISFRRIVNDQVVLVVEGQAVRVGQSTDGGD
jgi:hypothetical protein